MSATQGFLVRFVSGLNVALIPGILSFTYLTAKCVLKYAIRLTTQKPYDWRDALLWFPVDIVLLSATLSAAGDVHNGMSKNTATSWYSLLTVATVLTVALYGFSTRHWEVNKVRWARICAMLAWLISSILFAGTMEALRGGAT